jgi:hypothetical protein
MIRIALDEDDDAEHDEGDGDGAKSEHEDGDSFERPLSREMLRRGPGRRRATWRLTMDVSDLIPRKQRIK